ncbi:MAG: hypothetical protein V7K68_25510 [Nostoc sp.]
MLAAGCANGGSPLALPQGSRTRLLALVYESRAKRLSIDGTQH